MTEQEQSLIDCCTDNFDMERVHKVIEHLTWKWHSTDGVPTLFDIKQRVRKDFKRAVERHTREPHSVEGTGGFMYEIFRENGIVVHVRMRFELCSSDYDADWIGE